MTTPRNEARAIFDQAVEHTRGLSPATFDQWFGGVQYDDLTDGVLTLRAQNEFELRITSRRDPRYVYRGSLNMALGEDWTWRASGGYTHEDPTLRAWFAGGTPLLIPRNAGR